MNEDQKSKMTTADFQDCDNTDVDGCSTDQIQISENVKFPIFENQRPQIISRVKPKALDVARRLDTPTIHSCFDNDQWEAESKGNRSYFWNIYLENCEVELYHG